MGFFTLQQKDFSVIVNEMAEVENVNARNYLKSFRMRSILPIYVHIMEHVLGFCPKFLYSTLSSEADDQAEKEMKECEEMVLPHQLYTILKKDLDKKEQIRLLKGTQLTALQLGGLYIQAGRMGYEFSNYIFKGKPKDFAEKELPSFIHLKDDGEIKKYGKTTLSDGQLKNHVTSSTFIIARILDNGKHWFCLYQTKSGVLGNENGKYGSMPHIHFLSDSFGISRDDLVLAIKGGRAPSSKVHILLKM